MSDRELLKAAAKAAGYTGIISFGGDVGVMASCSPAGTSKFQQWNPLTDDGDALRLAVKLGIRTETTHHYAITYAGSVCAKQFSERINGDPCAAVRRCIVRAAAALAGDTGGEAAK